MTCDPNPATTPSWGASHRLIAAEKWKAKSAAMGRGVTEALVALAEPRPGMQVLDLASGTGEPGISLAQRVAPTGKVVAVDQSSELLKIAEERAQQRGLANFTVQVADAHELSFAADTFDLATCRFGVMFFSDARRALSELARVLKPRGRACFVAWGPFEQPYFATTMGIVHKKVGGPLIADGGPDMFRFAEPGSLSAVLRDAGFSEIREETRTVPWTWPGTVEEVWEYSQAVSIPCRPLLERVPSDAWPKINDEVHAAVRKYSDGENVHFGARVVLASAEKSE